MEGQSKNNLSGRDHRHHRFVEAGWLTCRTGLRNDLRYDVGQPSLSAGRSRPAPLIRETPRPRPNRRIRRAKETVDPAGHRRQAHARHEGARAMKRLDLPPGKAGEREGKARSRPRAEALENLSLHVLQTIRLKAGHQSEDLLGAGSRRLFPMFVRKTNRHGELRDGAGRQQLGSPSIDKDGDGLFHNLGPSQPSPRRYRASTSRVPVIAAKAKGRLPCLQTG